ncbi:DUF481 domain-containing protein [Urechidicola croceus]|nr:DUF481 domain-containing protein [Urechidicola croceus]
MVTDTSGWSGSIGLNINLTKNTKKIFKIDNRIHVQYKNAQHLILFMNDIDFEQLDGQNLISNSVQHLRYNYKIKSKIYWEFFGQTQYNSISKIDFRGLLGTGPRFKISNSEKYKFYLGSLIMYEYDRSKEDIAITNKDLRWSSYLSFSLFPSKNTAIVSTTYYQPKLDGFNDFRISSESSIAVKIFEKLAFKSTFKFNFDKFPVEGIPKSQYSFTNGLIYSFE